MLTNRPDAADVSTDGPHMPGTDEAVAPANLIIGLGAVGRTTIARLRRILQREGEAAATPGPVAADYLAIDVETPPGHVPAGKVEVMRSPDTPLFTLEMASVRTLTGLPVDVRNWLSRYDAALELGSDAVTNPRRLGSLLLAAKAAQFQEHLDRQVSLLMAHRPPGARLQIHVVGYLADGIGGGALTQLLVQIRRNRELAGRSHIVVYGLLPESGEPSGQRDREAAVLNTGAALTELSAAQRRRDQRPDGNEPQELGFNRLCDEILVIAPPPETGRIARDLKTLPEALAMTVRQRMLIATRVAARGGADDGQRRPIVAVAPKVLTTGRDEIEDALVLSLLQSALAQSLHANWSHRRGFLNEPRGFNAADYVRRPDVQNRWLISADHLIQSAPVLDSDGADANWRLMTDDWTLAITGILELAEGQPRGDRLDCVTRLCTQRYRQDFRRVGVPSFFQTKLGQRREIAAHIRAAVEGDLLAQWLSGERGLTEVRQVLAALIEQQRQRLASINERIANIRMAEEACRVRIVATHQEWRRQRSRGGWLPWRWFRREPDTVLHAYGLGLQELHVNMTRADGWLFAKALLPMLIEELERLESLVDGLMRRMIAGARDVDLMLDELSIRLEDGARPGTYISYLFDSQGLQRLVQDMLSGERFQMSFADAARQALCPPGRAADGFRALAGPLESGGWLPALFEASRRRIAQSSDHWAVAIEDFLKTSVYAFLERQAEGNFGALREIAAGYAADAAGLLPPSIDSNLGTRLYVGLPQQAEQGAFAKSLRSAFSFSRRSDVTFVDAEIDENMIHLLLVTAPFSIPDIELLRQMDRHYRTYVQRDRDYAMLSLHALGVKEDGPEEFSIGDAQRSAAALASLLVGLALRIVVERASGDADGRFELWLVPKDEDGFDDEPVHLASDLLSAGAEITGTIASMLEDNVARALDARGADGTKLIDAVVERVAAIRGRCNDNPADPVYRAFVEAGKAAAKLIRQQGNHAGAA